MHDEGLNDAARDGARPLASQVFASVLDLVGRLGLVTLLGTIATLLITRLLGPTGYGSYASAIATAAILGAAADFGFSSMLSRDSAGSPETHRSMLRAAYEVATAWSAVLSLVLVGLAVSAGLSTDRGIVLLVLAPSMLFNGLNPARVFLIVRRETRLLVTIDVLVMTAQVAAAVSVAGAGLGPIAVGVTVSAGSIVGNVVISLALSRRLERTGTDRFSRRLLVQRSFPLGLASIMTRIYLTIDLVLLGWLVSGPRLGQYAAASKLVTVLAGLAGTVMSGALPTLAAKARQSGELEDLAARIWHWLVVGALPLFVALALFARPLVTVALGHQYAGAAPLLRILALAGAIGVLSNLVGNLMIVFGRNRAMLVQNGVAIVFNIVGNLVLIPRYGVTAAAWLTVATEALVCLGAIGSIRSQVSFAAVRRVSGRPVIAIGAASGVALVLHGMPAVAAPAAAAAFLLVISALRAWPTEFRVRRWASAG